MTPHPAPSTSGVTTRDVDREPTVYVRSYRVDPGEPGDTASGSAPEATPPAGPESDGTCPTQPAGPPPVLLVHGFGSSFRFNWEQTGWVRALTTAGRTVVGLDLRGHGASAKPQQASYYSPAQHVADLEAVLDSFDLGRVDVVAYSMGSRMVWEFMRSHPGRVRRAALAGFGPYSAPRVAGRSDPGTADAVLAAASALPGNDQAALAACQQGEQQHPFTADPAPGVSPLLLAAGTEDELATDMELLAERLTDARTLRIPGRDHRTAVAARGLKTAVVEFLEEEG
ncbi:alpha/beta hydrolase [Lipingzhangella sp. LS1_29]|uniref:Alpha/beta hydrolase n=1 Tax=Lipingzhangella rawalii TaxID=2055835 RepID=A0ABU2H825_9ACTN|nr:alpha/beta hydrolase [Lipingzhangella rawalii]MDS1271005.1 alpha/beta hydrolase [Lipingzhangella rawalii]